MGIDSAKVNRSEDKTLIPCKTKGEIIFRRLFVNNCSFDSKSSDSGNALGTISRQQGTSN